MRRRMGLFSVVSWVHWCRVARTAVIVGSLLSCTGDVSSIQTSSISESETARMPSSPDALDASDREPLPTPQDLVAPPEGQGFQMGIDTFAPAGTEVWKCYVADIPIAAGIFHQVKHVESLQSAGVHHMDVMALGLLDLPIENGMHDCDALYAAYAEMMEEGIFLYASQLEREELTLPDGVAAGVPSGLKVMVELHYVNATLEDKNVWSRINAWTVPDEEVEEGIWGSAIRDVDINIPAGTENHVEWTRCVMNEDIELLFLSSHVHELSERVDVYHFDGTETGELFYQNFDWHRPELKKYDPPMVIKKGEGFEFRCNYRNPYESTVHWGFSAADEMCQIAIVHTKFDSSIQCDIVDSGAY